MMKTVVRILEGTSLANQSISNIEETYGVKITGLIYPDGTEFHKDEIIPKCAVAPEMQLEVEGDYKTMRGFCLASVDFKNPVEELDCNKLNTTSLSVFFPNPKDIVNGMLSLDLDDEHVRACQDAVTEYTVWYEKHIKAIE